MPISSTTEFTLNNMPARVEGIAEVAWYLDDESLLQNAKVIGRAEVNFVGGGRVDALVVERATVDHIFKMAVFWERTSRRFVAIEIERYTFSHARGVDTL